MRYARTTRGTSQAIAGHRELPLCYAVIFECLIFSGTCLEVMFLCFNSDIRSVSSVILCQDSVELTSNATVRVLYPKLPRAHTDPTQRSVYPKQETQSIFFFLIFNQAGPLSLSFSCNNAQAHRFRRAAGDCAERLVGYTDLLRNGMPMLSTVAQNRERVQ